MIKVDLYDSNQVSYRNQLLFTNLSMAMHNVSDFDQKLKHINLRLKSANIRVGIQRRGGSLYLRATLPPQPHSGKSSSHQQYLTLGVKATPAGLKQAEGEAKKLGAKLDLKEFDWVDYLPVDKEKADSRTAAELIAAFEADYFGKIERTPTTEESFKGRYSSLLKRLPQDQVITSEILDRVIRATTIPNSCRRAKICVAFKRFGTFAEIDVSFISKELKGTYSNFRPAPRDLPSDELIVEEWHTISNPAWRWVYGMMATFGLRPHEIFHLDTQELEQGGHTLRVLESTKTGYREVPPLHPEWIDQFGLRQKQLPRVTGRTNGVLGKKVSRAFRRICIPFPPYNLRHSYATRCIAFNINASLAARWMGHSVQIHTKVYQAWLSKAVEQEAFRRAIDSPSRPQPPGSGGQ